MYTIYEGKRFHCSPMPKEYSNGQWVPAITPMDSYAYDHLDNARSDTGETLAIYRNSHTRELYWGALWRNRASYGKLSLTETITVPVSQDNIPGRDKQWQSK